MASRERPEKSGCPLQYVDLRGGGQISEMKCIGSKITYKVSFGVPACLFALQDQGSYFLPNIGKHRPY
jgi:hypothetical protein